MTRRLATHAAAAAAGALLALLLTSTATSRQPSAPRPSAITRTLLPEPVAPRRTEAPTLRPSPSPTTRTGPASVEPVADPTPSATPKPTKRPRATTRPSERLSGVATWYSYRRGQAAAGPRLRAALGAGWRGSTVLVNGVPVLLSDFMGTKDRDKVIDLDADTFRVVCGPLSLGVCDVEIRW